MDAAHEEWHERATTDRIEIIKRLETAYEGCSCHTTGKALLAESEPDHEH